MIKSTERVYCITEKTVLLTTVNGLMSSSMVMVIFTIKSQNNFMRNFLIIIGTSLTTFGLSTKDSLYMITSTDMVKSFLLLGSILKDNFQTICSTVGASSLNKTVTSFKEDGKIIFSFNLKINEKSKKY